MNNFLLYRLLKAKRLVTYLRKCLCFAFGIASRSEKRLIPSRSEVTGENRDWVESAR